MTGWCACSHLGKLPDQRGDQRGRPSPCPPWLDRTKHYDLLAQHEQPASLDAEGRLSRQTILRAEATRTELGISKQPIAAAGQA